MYDQKTFMFTLSFRRFDALVVTRGQTSSKRTWELGGGQVASLWQDTMLSALKSRNGSTTSRSSTLVLCQLKSIQCISSHSDCLQRQFSLIARIALLTMQKIHRTCTCRLPPFLIQSKVEVRTDLSGKQSSVTHCTSWYANIFDVCSCMVQTWICISMSCSGISRESSVHPPSIFEAPGTQRCPQLSSDRIYPQSR